MFQNNLVKDVVTTMTKLLILYQYNIIHAMERTIVIKVDEETYQRWLKLKGDQTHRRIYALGIDALKGLITVPRAVFDSRPHALDDVYTPLEDRLSPENRSKKTAGLDDMYEDLESRQRKQDKRLGRG